MKEEFGHYKLPEDLAAVRGREAQKSAAIAYAGLELASGATLNPPAEKELRKVAVEDWKQFGRGVLNAIRGNLTCRSDKIGE